MTTHVESVAGSIFLIFYILVKCHVEKLYCGEKSSFSHKWNGYRKGSINGH